MLMSNQTTMAILLLVALTAIPVAATIGATQTVQAKKSSSDNNNNNDGATEQGSDTFSEGNSAGKIAGQNDAVNGNPFNANCGLGFGHTLPYCQGYKLGYADGYANGAIFK
jgi:hypothetical protein